MVDPNSARTAAGCGNAAVSTGPAPTPTATTSFYFAEGYTGAGFTECLSLFTPHAGGPAQIDYQLAGGSHLSQLVALSAGQVTTVNVNAAVGPDQEVATRVILPAAGVVERTMHFTTGSWHGSTDLVGVNQPATEWDFAEGSTLAPYSEYVTLQNPNASAVAATLSYFLDSGAHPVKQLSLAANSRTTVEMASGDLGGENPCRPGAGGTCGVGPGHTGVSVRVTAGAPIVVERPLYVNNYSFGAGAIRDGHDAFGANSATLRWDFAEGTTLNGFTEYLTVANPGLNGAHVSIRYLDGSGVTTTRSLLVAGQTRSTILVNDPTQGVGPGVTGVSAQVSADQPIVAERPMYMVHDFGTGPVAGAHDVMGNRRPWHPLRVRPGLNRAGGERLPHDREPERDGRQRHDHLLPGRSAHHPNHRGPGDNAAHGPRLPDGRGAGPGHWIDGHRRRGPTRPSWSKSQPIVPTSPPTAPPIPPGMRAAVYEESSREPHHRPCPGL